MVDRPATTTTLCNISSGQSFLTSLIPTTNGGATKVFDVDSGLTDTAISGAYIDEIFFRYTKKVLQSIDAVTAPTGTYSANSTTCTVTLSTGHNLEIGQSVFLDFKTYSSGTVPKDDTFTVLDTVNYTSTTFDVTIPSLGGTITGNVDISLPTDFCFYLVNTGTVTDPTQFLPLFVASVDSSQQYYSLTLNEILPLINHPTVQAGSNFGSSNNEVAPKQRGLMLKRGQALYVAASGATALTNGFFCTVQGGFY
jgi:hypothetical protein|tara:strand:- start:214 stop:972 length:759 start_codon:yes stop_codon:yes gene_type:complete